MAIPTMAIPEDSIFSKTPTSSNLEQLRMILTILALASTCRGSLIRYLCIPTFSAMLYMQINNPPVAIENTFQYMAESAALFNFLHQINTLVITGVDVRGDNLCAIPSLYHRLKSALFYATNFRGIGTVHQAKNIPSVPTVYYKKAGPQSYTWRFITRQLVLCAWQYLFVDVGCSLWHQLSEHERLNRYRSGQEWVIFNATGEERRVRLLATVVFWGTVRNLVDVPHRLGSAILTGLGVTSPHEWPPMCGSIFEVYTLRNFWGKWWHQQLRWPLTSYSNLITRRILNLSRPSLMERYLNNTIVHMLSAALHVTGHWAARIYDGNIGCFSFYMSFILGYMVEDVVQDSWKWLKSVTIGVRRPSVIMLLVESIIGTLWVMTFLAVTTAWWIYPLLRQQPFAFPYSFVDAYGMENVLVVIVVGAVILKTQFEASP